LKFNVVDVTLGDGGLIIFNLSTDLIRVSISFEGLGVTDFGINKRGSGVSHWIGESWGPLNEPVERGGDGFTILSLMGVHGGAEADIFLSRWKSSIISN